MHREHEKHPFVRGRRKESQSKISLSKIFHSAETEHLAAPCSLFTSHSPKAKANALPYIFFYDCNFL